MPLDIIYGTPPNYTQKHCQYAAKLRTTMETAYHLDREDMQTAVVRQKEHYDLKVHGDKFTLGQLVWLCNPMEIPRSC